MILGITGGICSGKTTAAAVFVSRGFRVIDADEISRFLTAYDPDVLRKIREQFGASVFRPMGGLDRGKLAEIVFNDDTKRKALEQILHPVILKVIRDNKKDALTRNETLLVVAPLMIESGLNNDVDHLIVISSSIENQLTRLKERSGIDRETGIKWIEAQMPIVDKIAYADTVIDNDGTVEDFEAQIVSLLERLDLA